MFQTTNQYMYNIYIYTYTYKYRYQGFKKHRGYPQIIYFTFGCSIIFLIQLLGYPIDGVKGGGYWEWDDDYHYYHCSCII